MAGDNRARFKPLTGYARVLAFAALASVNGLRGMTGALAAAPVDYSDPANWLCRPDAMRYCDADLSTTVVAADGTLTVEPFETDPGPPVDCFYLYPTVSLDPAPISDTTPSEDGEIRTVRGQFARFASVCRLFAPLYRQLTVTYAISSPGTFEEPDLTTPASDILAAWDHYLEHDNQGRAVVLIGHSQGAGWIRELVHSEIDGTPVQDRVLSAMLIGMSVATAKGKDIGGDFEHMPLCRDAGQIGCIIAYDSYRSTVPPTETSVVGTLSSHSAPGELMAGNIGPSGARLSGSRYEIACTNPSSLSGGSAELNAYLPALIGDDSAFSIKAQPPWTNHASAITTPFVRAPGLLSATCTRNEHAWYLEITVNGNSSDPRADDIGGDVLTLEGRPDPYWGLHPIDMHLTMGNLIEIVRRQSETYASRSKR
jgi:hypothetical protein